MSFSPRIIPSVPSEIDWSHPLSRGLLSLYLPGISLSDFVADGPTLIGGTAATIAPTPHGPGYADQVVNNGAAFAACPPKLKIAGNMTLLLRLYQISTMGGTSGGPLWGIQHDIANGAPFFDLALGSLANGQVFLACNDGAGGTLFTGFDFACTVGALSNVVGVYLPGGSSSCFLNSGLNGTAVATPSQTAFGAADLLTLGSAGAAEFIQPNLASLAGAIWGRALSTDEIAWLDAEPFAMLRPIARRTYFAPVTTINASLIKTTGPATLASTATAAIAASLSKTAGGAILASAATAAIAASLSETTGAATLVSAATVVATIITDPAILVSTATAAIAARLSLTAGPATLAATATLPGGNLWPSPMTGLALEIEDSIWEVGERVILRRPPNTDCPLAAVTRAYAPQQIGGGVVQGDRHVSIGNRSIAQSGWPGPPRRGDQIIFDGGTKTATIMGVESMTVGSEVVRHNIQVRGS